MIVVSTVHKKRLVETNGTDRILILFYYYYARGSKIMFPSSTKCVFRLIIFKHNVLMNVIIQSAFRFHSIQQQYISRLIVLFLFIILYSLYILNYNIFNIIRIIKMK